MFVEIPEDYRWPHRKPRKRHLDRIKLAATGGTQQAKMHGNHAQGHRGLKVDDHRPAWLQTRQVKLFHPRDMNVRSRQKRIAVPPKTDGIAADGQRLQSGLFENPVARQRRWPVPQPEIGLLQGNDICLKRGDPGHHPFSIVTPVGADRLVYIPRRDAQTGLGLGVHSANIGISGAKQRREMPATSAILLNGIRILLAVEAVIAALRGVWPAVFVTGVALLLTVLPGTLANRVGLRLPPSFLAAIALIVLATLYLGEVYDFYNRFWWWDLLLHFGSAMGFGILGFLMVFMLFQGDRYAAPAWAIGVLSFCLAMTVGALWEIFEYGMDTLFGFNMMKSGLPDTMGDLMVDAVGAALAALAGVVYLLGRAGRLGAPFDLFIQINRTRFSKVFSRRRRR